MSLSPLPYVGSKRTDIKYYKSFMPDALNIDICVEPYGGSGYNSLYLFSQNNNIKSIINDNDELLINFFTQIKNEPEIIIDGFNSLVDIYPNREEFKNILTEYKQNKSDNIRRAILYLFLSKFHGARRFLYPVESKKINKINKDKYIIFFKWLQNTEFNLKDYNETMKDLKNHDTDKKYFIFLDPPYLDSFNGSYFMYNDNTYSKETDNTKMYIDILDYLKTTKKKTLLIINKNCITTYLYLDYLKGAYDKTYQTTKKKTIHSIISNFGGTI